MGGESKAKMPLIYVAGPITYGDQRGNVRRAIDTGDILWRMGFAIIVPHLTYFYDKRHRHTLEEWLDLDFNLISRCDVLYRLSGYSVGADREVAYANQSGIPVLWKLADAEIYMDNWRKGHGYADAVSR
jgi:hypothetical protein